MDIDKDFKCLTIQKGHIQQLQIYLCNLLPIQTDGKCGGPAAKLWLIISNLKNSNAISCDFSKEKMFSCSDDVKTC